MSPITSKSSVSPRRRRFILLPEERGGRAPSARRIRRYALTSLGHGAEQPRVGLGGSGAATARIASELGRLGRM